MAKKDLPEPVGKCPICTINLYGDDYLLLEKPVKTDKGKEVFEITGKPFIFPCGISRINQGRCPWETVEEQKELEKMQEYELRAGLLGTMHTND